MSLYIGADSSNLKVLHMTKNAHDVASLQSGELSDTIFHSNLNYVQVLRAKGTILNSVLTVTQAVKDLIGTKAWIVVNSLGVCIPAIWGRSLHPDSGVYSPFYGKWDGLSLRLGRDDGILYGYDYYDIDSSNNGEATIYIFSVDILTSEFTKIPTTNNEIYIGDGNFNIRGFDVLDSAYISTTIVNDVDDKITMAGKQFQITNTNITGNEISLISNQSYSTILRNGVPFIDSTKNSTMRYRGSKNIYLPANAGSYAEWNIVTASVNFDETLPSNAFIVCSLNSLNNYPSDNNSFIFFNNYPETVFGRLAFNILTHWKVSVQVTSTQFILRSYFMVAGTYSILGNNYTIHIFY